MAEALAARWRRFWFEPADPRPLALCRVLFVAGVLVIYSSVDYRGHAEIPAVLTLTRGLFRDLHLPILSAAAIGVLQLVWKLSLALGAVGLFTRTNLAVSSGLAFYLLGLQDGHFKTHHFNTTPIFVLAILAVSRCGDAFSLDRYLARRRGGAGLTLSGEYTWPIRLVWLHLVTMLFSAAVMKATVGGHLLFTTNSFQNVLLEQVAKMGEAASYNFLPGPDSPLYPSQLNLWIASSLLLCQVMMFSGIVAEFLFPLAMFSRRARVVLVPVVMLMLASFSVLIGPPHYTYLLTGLFWIPWARLIGWPPYRDGPGPHHLRSVP